MSPTDKPADAAANPTPVPAATRPVAANPVAAAAAPTAAPATRRKALSAIAALVLLGVVGAGAYWWTALRGEEATDNAYVQGNVVPISAQVAGNVVAIQADDNDRVRTGQPLLRLDTADARLALQQAEAQLAQTVREVRGLYANNVTLGAQIQARQAETGRAGNEVGRMQAEVRRLQDDLDRRQPLLASGAVGQEEVAHLRAQLSAAQSALAAAQSGQGAAQSAALAAREQLNAGQVMTEGTSVVDHPGVQRAAARVREAYLALQRTEVPAPVDGVVARRSVQVGQRVAPGAPLLTVVELDKLWVDANFKEGQLKNLRIGQPATLVADVYGEQVVFHGKVDGLGAGTGAAFALLPAQNATGNWIKVVQRVPVRIALDAAELKAHPLRLGLSMTVKVDVSDTRGALLAAAPRSQPVAQTPVFDALEQAADAEVRKVLLANLPAGTRLAARATGAAGATGAAAAAAASGLVAAR